MSTAYGIVKQHGGYIWAYSEPGRGTTIKIYLPVSPESLNVARQPAQTQASARGFETILLVEDDRQVRHLSSIILR